MTVALKPEVLDRLLLSKSFLARIRFQVVDLHDRATLASHIVTSHDAAELAIAAICDELGCLPKPPAYLMDYFAPLGEKAHPDKDVHAKEFVRKLNDARILVKHRGLYVDARQWHRVAELTFDHISKWCSDYLDTSFAELDDAALIESKEARQFYGEAKALASQGKFKEALEAIAFALREVFYESPVLYNLSVGDAATNDALIVAGFGVRPNEFLALQRFLPSLPTHDRNGYTPEWKQSRYGHPGNWTEYTLDFCLRTLVDVAIKIQDAQWIPGPVERAALYELEMESLKDEVEIWDYVKRDSSGKRLEGFSAAFGGKPNREVVHTLKQGETWRGVFVSLANESDLNPGGDKSYSAMAEALGGRPAKSESMLRVMWHQDKRCNSSRAS